MLRKIGLAVALVIAVLATAHVAFRPPSLEGRTITEAVEASPSTVLGEVALAAPSQENGESGVIPLLDGPDAFAARVALIRAAEVALDVQYYIWQRDATGLILLDELRKAAERGVRVRLLLDDNGISGLDSDLAALDALPRCRGSTVQSVHPSHAEAAGLCLRLRPPEPADAQQIAHRRRRHQHSRRTQHRRHLFRLRRGSAIHRY